MDGVDDKSLLSNSDLKTDDTRGEDLTDVSRKQIDLNNPSTSMEVSVSNTELESTADKESAGEKPENLESNANSAGETPRVSGGSGEPNINSEKGESNANSVSEKPGLSGGSGEPNINSEKGESNANSVSEKHGQSGGSGGPNINSEKGGSNANSAGEKPGLSGGSGEPNINLENIESNADKK